MSGGIREFVLDGLDCPNCAGKIETKLNQIEQVNNASINFITKTLSLELSDVTNNKFVLDQTQIIVNQIEPGVVVREKASAELSRRSYTLEGLCCANCAVKMEREINIIPGVSSSSIDFITQRLTMVVDEFSDFKGIIQQVYSIVDQIEPGVKIVECRKTRTKHRVVGTIPQQEIIAIVIGLFLFIGGLTVSILPWVRGSLFLVSYLILGSKILFKAGRNIINGQIFDENLLMSIATLGAFAIGEYPEGVAVILFYRVGELLQNLAVDHSRRSITSLLDIKPQFVNIKIGGVVKKVAPEEVHVGDTIIVKPGEKVPLDGVVSFGVSMVNTSAITGEGVPREIGEGSEVHSGFINMRGIIEIEVSKRYDESTVAKILDLVQNAGSRKSITENFITRFARYYTPAVVLIALIIALIPPLFTHQVSFEQWIYRALIFLVISCPCALVVSIPLSFFGGIGVASKQGILIKGSNYLEGLSHINTVVFDKTGTLTKGIFRVTEIWVKEGVSKEQLLEYAVKAEAYSNHPIATALVKSYNKKIPYMQIKDLEELPGQGVKLKLEGTEIVVGNKELMDKENILCEEVEKAGAVVYVAVNQQYLGYIVVSDEIKDDAIEAVASLKTLGIKDVVMLTGDVRHVGEIIGTQLGVDQVYAELLPHQKVEQLEKLYDENLLNRKIVYIGDGINDAPVLARADVGIAMGGLGSDAAIEAADIVIMTDEPSKVGLALTIARKTKTIVWQNIVFALGVKFLVLGLGAVGLVTMWGAVFADVGVSLLAVLNSMRLLKPKGV